MANTFGARLILARNEKGLSQFTLAERAGMAQTQLSRYETDKVRPRLRIVNTLAAALSVDPDWLLNGDEGDASDDSEGTVRSQFRVPAPIHEAIARLAKASGRSVNAEIVHRLAQTLGEDFAAEQPAAQPVLSEMLAQMREQTGLLRDLVGLARDASSQPDDFRM
ncbi:MAG: helix-turn-helix domain-containing protein [Delftia acidovorans]|nr:helix-turn-helix domain-containing protein [Delftia acidovorans]